MDKVINLGIPHVAETILGYLSDCQLLECSKVSETWKYVSEKVSYFRWKNQVLEQMKNSDTTCQWSGCQQYFLTQEKLEEHLERDHIKEDTRVCKWKNCHWDFHTQEKLVKHLNWDHIFKENRKFVCQWKDCHRRGRAFNHQYMLVVHMRRHT